MVAKDIVIEDGVAHVRHWQPSARAILEFNKELRKNRGAFNNLTFAGWEMIIPEAHLYYWYKWIPDLDSHDRETKLRAWKAFIASFISDPYRTYERRKKRVIHKG